MSCSPYGYDPRNLSTHREYAGEFPTFDEADSYNSWFARSVAQTRPLHRWRRKDFHRSIEADPMFLAV
jgi:hypothetical protein